MLIWHYTIQDRFEGILADGRIKRARVHLDRDERMAVWFSSNQHYEMTARKGTWESGVNRTLTFIEMTTLGLVRIGVEPSTAPFDWREFTKRSGISRPFARRLEKAGRMFGANPNEWFVSFDEVTVDKFVRVESYVMGRWIESEIVRFTPAANLEVIQQRLMEVMADEAYTSIDELTNVRGVPLNGNAFSFDVPLRGGNTVTIQGNIR
jgi:hypothetical protein